MNQPPLNPDGVLNAMDSLMAETDADARATEWARNVTTRVLEGYFAAALPEVTSVPGVYDLGSPEPVGVDQVIECDEFGEPDERDDTANDPTWSKTTDGTRWKGYKDGKEYRSWADLVRRYGPLVEYRPEVKP